MHRQTRAHWATWALPRFTRGVAVLTVLFSGGVLLGWLTNSLQLARLHIGFIPMAPASALCFAALGGVLLARPAEFASRQPRWLWRVLAGGVLLVSGALLAQFALVSLWNVPLDLERWLTPSALSAQGFVIGRMSPLAAGLFALLAGASWVSGPDPATAWRRALVAQSAAGVVLVSAIILVVGYWYGAPLLYGGTVTPVALTSAVGFLLLSVGWLCESPQAWFYRWIVSEAVVSRFTRLVLPGTTAIILTMGWLHLTFLEKLPPVYDVFFFSLLILVSSGLIALLVFIIARQVQTTVTRGATALRESETRFRTLFEQAAVGVALLETRTGRYVRINQTYCDFLGYTPAEMLQKSYQDITHPQDVQANTDYNAQLMTGEIQAFTVDKRFVRQDGQVVWGELTGSPLWRPGETPAEFLHVAVVVDITKRKQAELALRESEARFRAVTDTAPDAIITIDQSGQIVHWNGAAEKMFSYPLAQAVGRPVTLIMPDHYQAPHQAMLERAVTAGKLSISGAPRELTGRTQGGREFPIELSLAQWSAQDQIFFTAIVRDITERQQAEEALRLDSAMLANIGEGVGLIRASDGRIMHANAQFERIFGYGPGELIGQSIAVVNAPTARSPEETAAEIIARLNTHGVWAGEIQNIKKDGTRFWCQASVSTFAHSLFGQVWVTVHQDITERKQAELLLKESEVKYRTVAEHTYDWEYWLGTAGQYIYISPSCERITGYRAAEFMAQPDLLEAITHPDDRELVREHLHEAPETHLVHTFDFRVMARGGETHWIAHARQPVYSPDGRWLGSRGSNRDITQRKQIETELRMAQTQLELTARRLQALAQRLVEVQEAERRELSRELHDRIGQNLTGLNINLSLILSQLAPDALEKVGQRLQDSSKLVEETIEHIRDVMGELRPAVLDDYGLAAALRWHAERVAARTGLTIQVVGENAVPQRLAPAVESTLFRIAQEALNNVVKHARAQQVRLTLGETPTRLVVTDDGQGFELPGGGGWGLSIMHERAQAIGARLTVHSARGQGTSIIVEVNP